MTGAAKEINCSLVTNFFYLFITLVGTQEKQKNSKSHFLASLSYEAMLLFTGSPNHCTRKTTLLVLAWGDLKTVV